MHTRANSGRRTGKQAVEKGYKGYNGKGKNLKEVECSEIMKAATLHLMVGLPGAGKTTAANQIKDQYQALVLSPDIWQLALFGDDFGQPVHNERHDVIEGLLWQVAEQTLKLGTSVILDFGFWSKAERNAFRQHARVLGVGFRIHFLDTPLAEIEQRLHVRNKANGNDTFHIAFADILGWAEHFQPPTDEEIADWF